MAKYSNGVRQDPSERDTRDLKPGKYQYFFAVTGEYLDGHDFISPELYSKGCVGVVGSRVCDGWDKGLFMLKVLFGKRMGCHVRLVAAENTDGGLGVRVALEKGKEMVDFVIPSPGLHLSLNACAAATVAILLGVSLAQVGISLSKFVPVHMRSELQVGRNGIKIVNDAYNANPISTERPLTC